MYLDAVKWLSNQGNYTLNLTFGNGIMSVKIYSCTILLYGFFFFIVIQLLFLNYTRAR
jgi:hypothetical protein